MGRRGSPRLLRGQLRYATSGGGGASLTRLTTEEHYHRSTGTSFSVDTLSMTSPFFPNKPAHLPRVFDTRFEGLVPTRANAEGLSYNWDGRPAIDSTAPYGPNVFETFYAEGGLGGGTGGSALGGYGGSDWREAYFSMAVWVSPNYSTHSNEEKFWYPLLRMGQTIHYYNLAWWPIGAPSDQGMTWKFSRVPGSGAWAGTDAPLLKGRWSNVEVYMRMNTPGQANGVLRIWVDGRVALDDTNILYREGNEQTYIDMIRFTGTRGGGNSIEPVPPGGQVRRYNRLAFFAR